MAIDLTGNFFNITQQKIRRGQGINLDFSVVNNGDEAIQPFDFDIVISQDDVIDANDVVIGNYEIRESIAAGQDSGVKSFRYRTPGANSPFWLDGDNDYTVGIRIDPQNSFLEDNEDNNSNSGNGLDLESLEVVDFGDSDLVSDTVSIGNTNITPGGKVDLSFVVKNDSEELANPFSVDIYLSSDDSISDEDVQLGTYDIRNIVEANADTGVKRFVYNLPELNDPIYDSGSGEYNIVLDIDSKAEVSETNKANNTATAGLNITGIENTTDLIISSFSALPTDLEVGQTVTVDYEVSNTGDAPADLFGTGFYLFNRDFLDTNGDVSLDNVPDAFFIQGDDDDSLISLEGGESKTLSTELTIPRDFAGFQGAGEYFIGAQADVYDDVAEIDETNNSITAAGVDFQAVNLSDAPSNGTAELTISDFSALPTNLAVGQTVTVEYEVTNSGNGEADLFDTGFYLFNRDFLNSNNDVSLDNVPDVFFIQGDSDSSLINLKAGESKTLSTELTIPEEFAGFSGPGEYFIGAQADVYDDVAEIDETNNSITAAGLDFQAVNISDAPGGTNIDSDLITTSFAVNSDELMAGDTVGVTYEILNDGTESADLFAAGFYIFTEEYVANNDSLDVEDVPGVFFIQGDDNSSLISLGAGESTTMTTELTLPDNLDSLAGLGSSNGEYLIGFAADPFGDIAESDETNNSLNGLGVDYAEVSIV